MSEQSLPVLEATDYQTLVRRWNTDAVFHARVATAVSLMRLQYRKDHKGADMTEDQIAMARLAAGYAVAVMESL